MMIGPDRRALFAVATLCGLAACATAPQIAAKEDMLAAAGFVIRPADTPERIASLRQLPPHRFLWKTRDGKLLTVYADPTVCGCLYVGDQAAYQAYRREVFQKQLADENRLSAMEDDNAAMMNTWPWEPWGYW